MTMFKHMNPVFSDMIFCLITSYLFVRVSELSFLSVLTEFVSFIRRIDQLGRISNYFLCGLKISMVKMGHRGAC